MRDIFHYLFRCKTTGLIATACGDDYIRIFKEDPESSDPHKPSFVLDVAINKAHENDVNSISWNPGLPGILASCSDDSTVKLWQYLDHL